jgi:hypothetical protein
MDIAHSKSEMRKTEFHPKAYLHLAMLVVVAIALSIVWNIIKTSASGGDLQVFWWMFVICAGILALSLVSTVLSHWHTLAIEGSDIIVAHKITGNKKIALQEVASAELIESRGGRGYIYHSIELSLRNGKKKKLDGLYNQGLEQFCEELKSLISK